MEYRLLPTINSPRDIKQMDFRQLEQLCAEIRSFLIESVSRTGGHLSSNLGVIELTVALHRIYNAPADMLLFDVGHQCYTHKLLTGRRQDFEKLRCQGGLSGFPCPAESSYDLLKTGHGSTALSAGIGLARAKKIKKEPGYVVVVIGDGAFTGGMVYEALNNIEGLDNLVVVLNDNKMSISKNDGAMGQYFSRLRTSPGYYKAKSDVKSVLDNTPIIGEGVMKGLQSMKTVLRRSLYHSTFFEDMGFWYMGPVDGHDIAALCNIFEYARRETDRPVFIHTETTKGKGFRPAEKNPGAFHGVGSFNAEHIADPDVSPQDSFSTRFGQKLAELGREDKRLCAITAAMKYGTGLQYFKKAHGKRFFDVGMAEEHAVTFGAGLALDGLKPVVAIYSTFLQRAYDQIIHDLMLQDSDVLLAIDRAGLVPGDGETHQGVYDAAYLSQQSNLPVVSPCNYAELEYWLTALVREYNGPRAIRYPRGEQASLLANKECTGARFDHLVRKRGAKAAIITYGGETEQALEAANSLNKSGSKVDVFQLVWINPLPEDLLKRLLKYEALLFAEEGICRGGIGEHLALQLLEAGYRGRYKHIGVPETGIDHAAVNQLKAEYHLDTDGLSLQLQELMV